MQLGEPDHLLGESSGPYKVAPVRRDQRRREHARRRFLAGARVRGSELAGLGRVRCRELEPSQTELHDREVPECVGGAPLVPVSPVRVEVFEQPARTLELTGPEQDVGDGEVRLGTRLLAGQRGQLCGLLRQPEASCLPAVQVHERETGKRCGAQTVVTDLLGELDGGTRVLLCRLHSLTEADAQSEVPVQRGAERRRRARLGERLALELDRPADVVALDLGCESERLRPRRPRRGHREQLLGERAGPLDRARDGVGPRGSCYAPGERNAVVGRPKPDRVLAELGRGDRCGTLGCGCPCRLLELACSSASARVVESAR